MLQSSLYRTDPKHLNKHVRAGRVTQIKVHRLQFTFDIVFIWHIIVNKVSIYLIIKSNLCSASTNRKTETWLPKTGACMYLHDCLKETKVSICVCRNLKKKWWKFQNIFLDICQWIEGLLHSASKKSQKVLVSAVVFQWLVFKFIQTNHD